VPHGGRNPIANPVELARAVKSLLDQYGDVADMAKVFAK
jgi:hypothetical protein